MKVKAGSSGKVLSKLRIRQLTPCIPSCRQDAPTQLWWKRHGHLSAHACEHIDWDGTNDLMHSLTPPERCYVTKHASSNCGVGTTLVKWKHQADNACPRYGIPEDGTHVYLCNGQNASATWNSNLIKLEESLIKFQTDPSIVYTIVTSLFSWRQDGTVPLHLIPQSLHCVIHQQTLIRWRALV